MIFLKTLIFCLFIGLIILANLSKSKSKDQKTSNNIANGINMTCLLLWIEMKRSENYFFFTVTLSKNFEIEANIVPHQSKFKKFILNNKEIELEGTEFPNIFDTNTIDPVKLRKILTLKAMANIIDNSKKYQEVLSMSFVNNKFTLF